MIALVAIGSGDHRPVSGLALVFTHEQQLTDNFNFNFVEPTWRGDCQYVAGIRTTDAPGNPTVDSVGDIVRTFAAPPDLVEEVIVPIAFPNGPGEENRYVRYSPATMLWRGIQQWVISWETAGTSQVWVQADVSSGMMQGRNKISADDASEPNFPEISNAGADPNDTDPLNPRRWVVHEQDIPNFDDTVRSRVVEPGATRENVIVAYANGNPTHVHEKPRWSLRNTPGYSRGYVVFHPQSELEPDPTLRRYVATRYAFAPFDDPNYPIRVAIADRPDRSTSFPVFSPDGRYIAYELKPNDPVTGDPTGPTQIFVAEFPEVPETAEWPIPEDEALPPPVWRVSADDPTAPGAREYLRPQWDSSSRFLVYLRKDGFVWQVAMRRAVPAPIPATPEHLVSVDTSRNHGGARFSPCPNSCFVVYHRETVQSGPPFATRYQLWTRQVAVPQCPIHF